MSPSASPRTAASTDTPIGSGGDARHRIAPVVPPRTRRIEGKDTGRVRFQAGGFEIVADLPKRTEWDQGRLRDAVAVLRGWGEDPAAYVAVEMSVPESRYAAWPPRIRTLFEPARTVGTGRPTYSLRSTEP